jgi:hypothetical protein
MPRLSTSSIVDSQGIEERDATEKRVGPVYFFIAGRVLFRCMLNSGFDSDISRIDTVTVALSLRKSHLPSGHDVKR